MRETLLARLEALEEALHLVESCVRGLRRELAPGPPTPVGPAGLHQPLPSQPRLQPPVPDPAWIPVQHAIPRTEPGSAPPCFQTALYLTEPPREGVKARLDVMRIWMPWKDAVAWVDPRLDDLPPLCAGCGVPVEPFSNRDLDYLSLMQPAYTQNPSKPTRRGRKRSEAVPGSDSPDDSGETPPIFSAHTPEATQEILNDLQRLSQELGLPAPS